MAIKRDVPDAIDKQLLGQSVHVVHFENTNAPRARRILHDAITV